MSERENSKTGYLAVYDYGTGGLWLLINARSMDEISAKYPVLSIVDTRPAWMTDEVYRGIVSKNSMDIDGEPPSWLRIAMKE